MDTYFAIAMPGMGELVIIFLIVLVLFGASRIPEIARSVGKGIVEFKRAINTSSNGKKDKDPSKEDENKS